MQNKLLNSPEIMLPGYPSIRLNLYGKITLLLDLLYRQGLLPQCRIYGIGDTDNYEINGMPVGQTEEEVTTAVWLMVESYAAEGHIDFRNNPTVAERHAHEL